jgi:hypothetical protein
MFVIVAAIAFVSLAAGESGETKVTRAGVPKAVRAAFTASYPKATMHGFSREKEDGVVCYEIESKEGGVSRDVLYHADGTVVEVEESIAAADLPPAVIAAVANLKPAAKLVSAEKITNKNGTGYEVHLKRGTKASELVFNANGEKVKL